MRVDVLLEPDQTPAQLTELALLCEQQGIGTMWLQNYTLRRDAFMALVPAALATRRVGLGVCVISPFEMHPVKMTNALLTLQEYTGGRAGLVIGGGGEWPARLGIQPERRVRVVREAVELVHGACNRKPFTYKGELYKVYNYRPEFGIGVPPLVYAGANKPQMIHATVPAGDGVMYSDMVRGRIGETVRLTHAALEAKGRPVAGYRVSNVWAWHIKPDPQVARLEALREMLLRGLLERWYLEAFMSPEDCDLMEKHKPAFYKAYREHGGGLDAVPAHLLDSLIANFTFTGTPDGIEPRLGELQAFQDAGVTELCLRLHDDPADAIRLIGERVIPHLA